MMHHFLQKKNMGMGNKFYVCYFDLGGDDVIKLEYWIIAGEAELDSQELIDREYFKSELDTYLSDVYTKKKNMPDYQMLEQAIKFVWSKLFLRKG
jgi:hypothetical protein